MPWTSLLNNGLSQRHLRFGGVVISDWDGIDYLSKDYPEAIAQGLNAGIDVFMVSENWREFLRAMEDLIAAGGGVNDPLGRCRKAHAASQVLL